MALYVSWHRKYSALAAGATSPRAAERRMTAERRFMLRVRDTIPLRVDKTIAYFPIFIKRLSDLNK
jgi:hypothetical protein